MPEERIFNGYEFDVRETGTTSVNGDMHNVTAGRDSGLQASAGGAARESGDDGGHLVAARFNGPAIPENMFAQDSHLNRGPMNTVERGEANAINNGASINTTRTAHMSYSTPTGGRPEAFMISDRITTASGTHQEIYLSFQNVSVAEQEANNQFLEAKVDVNAPNPGDSLRGEFSPSGYAELMESTDKGLATLSQEFQMEEYTSYSPSVSEEFTGYSAESEAETTADMSASAEISGDCEADAGGVDATADDE